MKKVFIETYGCQMNVSDTEVVFSILADAGYSKCDSMEEADVILANTCSVRDGAEQRIHGRISQFNRMKRPGRTVVCGILGCMAERMKTELLQEVDVVCGPDSYRKLPAMLDAALRGERSAEVELSRTETYSEIVPRRMDTNGVGAFISIMRGCNNVCSYCIVPYTRGAERSREFSSIVREACACARDGYREITLLGQNVDSYSESGRDFADLLEAVADAAPGVRIRFSTSHPKDISDKLIDVMASRPNICHQIHLPVQSGSDRILEKMRRRYTREWYLGRVRRIREAMPDCVISTDVIAGFCSETPEDHAATLSLFREVGFDSAFMFQYSERPGTLAARNYPDDVPAEEKTRRLEQIISLQNELSLESNRRDVGREFEVLVEGPSKKGESQLCGRTQGGKMCVWEDREHKAGDFVRVKVVSCTQATLISELI